MGTILRNRFLAAALAVILLSVSAAPAVMAQQINQLRSYADVAEKTMPAVVNISTDQLVKTGSGNPFSNDPFFKQFFDMPDDENHGGGSQGKERVERSMGSGVVISSDGYILTNNHVIDGADKVRVTFMGEKEYEAVVIGTDPPTDVALLKIDAKNLPSLEIANSDQLRVGDQVMAIGNPFGVGQTITMGIVSALGRNINLMDYSDMIQTDASINPGNSGGALVDMNGRLVGMNSAMMSRSGGSSGVGFAIPSNMAMRIVKSLRDGGSVQRAYLGVLPQPVDQALADYYGMDRPKGVLVAQVNADTPAERAGLLEGDIILEMDGKAIKNPSTLRNVVSLSEVGHTADLTIVREGKEKILNVKLAALPAANGAITPSVKAETDEDESLDGVTVKTLSDRGREMMQLPEDLLGLVVMNVAAASNAAREGLATGDVILEVGRDKVTNVQEFRQALGKNTDRPIFMKVFKVRQGRSLFMAVKR